jgi:hypothetical protein
VPTILAAALAALQGAGAGGAPPLESGAVRELELREPPGTRVEHFRLDLPGRSGSDGPLGLVRWVSGPDPVAGRRIECETTWLDAATQVLHAERLRTSDRKLVWREVRAHSGRTVLLEWDAGGALRSSETLRGELVRRELDASRGALMPLFLVEEARRGAAFDGRLPIFRPLSNDLETCDVETRVLAPFGVELARTLEVRSGGLRTGRWLFAGGALIGFEGARGGPVATPIATADYLAWRTARLRDPEH